MKKIYSLMLLAIGCAFIASCQDDDTDNPYAHESVVKIVSALPLFEAGGGTAKFAVEAPGAVTVTSPNEWVTAAVEGDSVVVTVPVNGGVEGRSGRVFVKYGEDEVAVSVIQTGMTFSIDAPARKVFGDEVGSATHKYSSVVPLKAYTDADWITVSVEDDKLSYSVSENTTGRIRGAYLYYECGPYKDSIQVAQGAITDIVGDYTLTGFVADPTKTTTISRNVSIEVVSGNSLVMNIKYTSYNWQIPLTFNKNTLSVSLKAGQSVGKMASYDVRTILYTSTIPDVLGASSMISMTGSFSVEDGQTVCKFADNGSFATTLSNPALKADVLSFYTYKNDSRLSAIPNFSFRNPVLKEVASK